MSSKVTYDSKTKTWSGPKVPYPFGNASVGELIFDNLKKNLDFVCQVSVPCTLGKFKITKMIDADK